MRLRLLQRDPKWQRVETKEHVSTVDLLALLDIDIKNKP
jgi:hypothetical protein